jgi:hypothetical protein
MVRIEHTVADFDRWKAAFDSDPVGRQQGGVREYRVLRPLDDRDRVAIELEFDDRATAAAFGERLTALWASPSAATLGLGLPELRVAEIADSGSY